MAKEIHIKGSRRLGPLTPLVGEWEGNIGVDSSFHNQEGEIGKTGYFEKASFKPIPVVNNGKQMMDGLIYSMTAWRHGEEAMDPFHDETGYLLWDKANGQIMRCFAVPRGLAILAGGDSQPWDTVLKFKATPNSPTYGLSQNQYLMQHAQAISFDSTFTINEDGSFSYVSDLVLRLTATGAEMHHTDRNTLYRVKRYHPSEA